MRRIVLVYGLIAGAIVMLLMTANIAVNLRDGRMDLEGGQVFGYASMVLAFLLVFFGVRRYRDTIGGGAIGFWRAVGVGLLVTLVVCAVYVLTWQVLYFGFFPDFAERYAAAVLDEMRARGDSAAAIASRQAEMARFAEWYRNPLFNMAITFLEIFPVGLVMTLISAAILRRRVVGFSPETAPG